MNAEQREEGRHRLVQEIVLVGVEFHESMVAIQWGDQRAVVLDVFLSPSVQVRVWKARRAARVGY